MKARWLAMAAKFAALQKREKRILAVAVAVGIVMIGHTFWIEPAQLRAAKLKKQIAADKLDVLTLEALTAGLKAQIRDPDAPNKAALAEAKTRIAAAERELRSFDQTLVPPERVPQLLQSLFARHRGVELVSLQTLPPMPLLAPAAKADAKAEAKGDAKGAAAKMAAPRDGNIHKHGLEIRMAGNYLDLLAYLAELEQLPQKLLWGKMSLTVAAYPRNELALTVYTLSLDPVWLVM